MNQFDQPSRSPKYTLEKLAEYLRDTDEALFTNVKVLMRGFEESPGVYKPWPKADVKKFLTSLLSMFEQKVKLYEGAEDSEKTQKARLKVQELRKIFAAIDSDEEALGDFLQTVKQAVESDINLPENLRKALNN